MSGAVSLREGLLGRAPSLGGDAPAPRLGRLRDRRWTAALPFYDLPELRPANQALALAVTRRLEAQGLERVAWTRSRSPVWSRLLFGQVCGYRYASRLSELLQPIATPLYRAEGVDGASVRAAVLVAAADPATGLSDLRGRRLALSPADLNSANLLRSEVAALAGGQRYFAEVKLTAGLASPAQLILDGEVDAALLDAVVLGQLRRLQPALAQRLRVLAWTARSPAPPFVCARALDAGTVEALGLALSQVAEDPALHDARAELLIAGVEAVDPGQYRAALHHQQIAQSLGYAVLA